MLNQIFLNKFVMTGSIKNLNFTILSFFTSYLIYIIQAAVKPTTSEEGTVRVLAEWLIC